MVVTPLPVVAAPAMPATNVPAPAEMLFTGMLQQLLTEITPPPVPQPALPAAAVQGEPIRTPLRARHEPPPPADDAPLPTPQQINFAAVAPVIVLPPPPPPLPPSPDPIPVGEKSQPPAPVAVEQTPVPSPAPGPAVVVAVSNTDVAVRAPEVKEAVPEHHEELPEPAEPAGPADPVEVVVAARPLPKIEAPKPVTMPDPVVVEKPAPTQPVRSVALDFRPDGTHDVRVRLAEHGGEVHVSVHSADPAVTQGLREGVTGLAATLAQAGYDARAWTPEHGQRQQQPREERAAKRDKRAADTKFDGALEEVSR